LTGAPSQQGVRAAIGWFAVGVLLAAYALSFLDRQLITLLVQPIKLDLGITDTQMGLLQGPAFGLFYATMGLPLGWLADRVHRVHLIAVAIVLWSLMTFLSGYASEYWMLLLCRFGVGFGEAALVPAAISLLADLFEPRLRALPVSVFTAGLAVGSGLSLIVGGALISFASTGASTLPFIGSWFQDRESWQVVFMLSGLVGLPISLLTLAVVEPRTAKAGRVKTQIAHTDEEWRALGVAWQHILRERDFFWPMLTSMAALFVISTSVVAWLPSVFIRDHGWTPAEVGAQLGPVILGCALVGNLIAGCVSRAMVARGIEDATLRTIQGGAIAMVPFAVITGFLDTALWALAFAGALFCATSVTFSIASLSFVEVTPPRMRGQVVALYLLLANFFGLALGPPGVGLLTDSGVSFFGPVGAALGVICLLAGIPGLWWLARARRAFVPLTKRLEVAGFELADNPADFMADSHKDPASK